MMLGRWGAAKAAEARRSAMRLRMRENQGWVQARSSSPGTTMGDLGR